jgi:NTP pyrophosphatase (non-canonical NTP hydrolase)
MIGIVPLTNLEKELSDIILRVLDTAVMFGVDIEKAVYAKNEYNKTRSYRHGGKLN